MTKQHRSLGVLTIATLLSFPTTQNALAMTPDEQLKAQQEQIDKQATEISALKEQVRKLLELSGKNEKLISQKVNREEFAELNTDRMVSSSKAAPRITLYGQVNRAGLYADNGDSADYYFVDNDNSSTRMGLKAKATTSGGNGIGAKIEYQLESNSSSDVNQLNQSSGTDIDLRHADLWFVGNFGKLAIGRGNSASNGSAEVDLSGTSVVTYSSISDMAGGQLWYDTSTNALSKLEVGDVFDNMDGLSRRNRFRYDTPKFHGISLAGSVIESEAWDIAARYSRKYDGGINVAAALAYSDSSDLKSWNDQISGSLSIRHDNGISVTFAAGQQHYDESDRDNPAFWYGKLGYQTQLFSFGKSAFSIDYGIWEDVENNGDESDTFSLAYVQKVDEWGSEFYLAYRLHTLDSSVASYDDINSLMMGARVKF